MPDVPEDDLDDDDFLDGCDIDFTEHAVDDETASLLPLFPTSEADEETAQFWRDVASEAP